MHLLPLLLSIALPTSELSQNDAPLERFEQTQVHMGAPFNIVAYAGDETSAQVALKAAFARIAALDRMLSDYKSDSELNRLSRQSPTKTPVAVSRELFQVLTAARKISDESKGAFDVTVGPLTKLWRRARRRQQLPAAKQLQEAKRAVGYRYVKLHSEQRVELLAAKMRIDLGGIAKGYAVDEALRTLEHHGIRAALVNGGGDLAASDAPPDKPGWLVGIAPLEAKASPSRFVSLKRQAIATSGDAWQFVEVDGKRYSHILDPETGVGLATRSSVSVLAPTCMLADSLASAVSVLGRERGLALIEKRKHTEAFIVEVDGEKPIISQSSGFASQPAP